LCLVQVISACVQFKMSAFGRPNAFGSTTGTGTFGGMNQSQGSLFGNTTGFGTTTTSNNLFGQPQQTTTGSIFGNTTTQPQNSVFGTSTATTGFGTSNTLFSSTNAINNSQSLFGGNKFGTTSTNLFGSSTPGTMSSFTGAVSNVVGTTVKFNPLISTDVMIKNGTNSNINTRHQCITCMKEYENKSLEELRYEDYQANRKGTTGSTMFSTSTQPQSTGGLFGTQQNTVSFNAANTASNSLFSANKPTFGAPSTTTATTSIFNTTFNKPFNTTAFGTTTQQPAQTTSLFGTTPANTTGFGQQPTTNLFNMTSQANTATNQVKPSSFFSTPATTQTNSLFGNSTASSNTLGATKPMFGTSTTAFGAPASSASFNFSSATQPATTSTSLFSNNAGTTSLFNTGSAATQQKSMFNFPTTTGLGTQNTLNTLNATGQQSNSLFGNNLALGNTNLGTSGSLFGNTNTAGGIGGSLFGNTSSSANLFGSTAPNQGTMLSLQQISSPSNQQNNDLLMNRLQSLPYGSSSLFQNKVGSSPTSNPGLKFTTDPKVLNKYKVSFSSNSSNQVQRVPTNWSKNTSLLFDGLDDDNPDDKKTAFNIFVPRRNIKKLTIKPKEILNSSSSAINNSANNDETSSLQTSKQQTSVPSLKLPLASSTAQKRSTKESTVNQDNTVLEYFRPQATKVTQYSSTPANNNQNNLNVGAFTSNSPLNNIQSPAQSIILVDRSNSANKQPHHIGIINSPEASITSLNDSQNYSILGAQDSGDICPSPMSNMTYSVPKCKVILNRTEYFTIPPLEQLEVEDETCVVESFTVGRHGYGSIFWEGPIDIYGLNLDEIVHIRRKEVIVYPDDENKPEEGFGLNRPAQITLHKVWPVDKTTHELIKDPRRLMKMNYSEKIEAATIKFGGIFKEYRPDTGSWVFKVKHFSKYGLVDEEDEDQMQTDNQPPQSMPFQSLKTDPKQIAMRENIENYYHPYDMQQQAQFQNNAPHHYTSFNNNDDQQLNFLGRPVQQRPTNDNIFLNLDEDESTTDGLDEEDEEILDDYPDEMPVANTYNYLLRNVLFENEDKLDVDPDYEKSNKKTKLLLKPDIAVDQEDYLQKQAASFSFIQPQYTQKIDLVLEPDDYAAKNKLYYDISSIKCSKVPKVRFSNGLNNLIIIDGRNVNVCKLQLIPELNTGSLNERFNLQMKYNSEICFQSNDKAPYIQVKPTIENKYNIDRLEKLVKALYGSLDGIASEHEYNQERSNRIIDWLTEQNRKQERPANLYERIIYYLASNEIKLAVDDLITANHPKLAILLCSGNNYAIKSNICQQLLEWKTLQGDEFIPPALLKIYVLLSGETRYRLSNNHQIDVLENLTWTQQLALLLLYSVENSLKNCINYMTCETNDVEYHLIANNDPLVAMSSAENDLEAWFLHQSLKSYGIVRPEVNSNVQHSLLASELMCQDIRWACYVACHITHDLLREYTLKELLFHFVERLNPDNEEWLKRNLNISNKYIASVKAIHAKSKFNLANYGSELLECEEWVKAHEVLVEHIFPELVINEEHTKLRNLIDRLKPASDEIPNWYTSGGHLFDIYCQCMNSEAIDEELINQPFNFNAMKCTNNRQRLCQSEMARKINLIYHEFNSTKFLIDLPVPSDYALRELQFNSRSILKELCS